MEDIKLEKLEGGGWGLITDRDTSTCHLCEKLLPENDFFWCDQNDKFYCRECVRKDHDGYREHQEWHITRQKKNEITNN